MEGWTVQRVYFPVDRFNVNITSQIRFLVRCLAIVASILILGVDAHAQVVVGSIAELTGSAQVTRGGSTIAATNAMPVELHDRLATSSGAHLTVRLNDGSTLSLAESSTLTLDEQVIGPGGVRQSTRVSLLAGRLYAVVSTALGAAGASTFQVNTPNAVAGVRGTRFDVSFSTASPVCGDRPSSDVGVLEGSVAVNNSNATSTAGEVIVGAGYETVVCDGAPPLPPGPLGLAGDGTAVSGGGAHGYAGAQPGAGGAPPPACPVCLHGR
jgi:hypothetical protein